MSRKSVTFSSTPRPTTTPDEWVDAATSPPSNETAVPNSKPKMKRLTIDVPEDLHRRFKIACAERGLNMADELRTLLEKYL